LNPYMGGQSGLLPLCFNPSVGIRGI